MRGIEHAQEGKDTVPGDLFRIFDVWVCSPPAPHRLRQIISRRVQGTSYTGTRENPIPFALYVAIVELAKVDLSAEHYRQMAALDEGMDFQTQEELRANRAQQNRSRVGIKATFSQQQGDL